MPLLAGFSFVVLLCGGFVVTLIYDNIVQNNESICAYLVAMINCTHSCKRLFSMVNVETSCAVR